LLACINLRSLYANPRTIAQPGAQV